MGYLLELATSPRDNAMQSEEAEIRTWLDRIEERDPVIREHVLRQCRNDPGAREYFLLHARGARVH